MQFPTRSNKSNVPEKLTYRIVQLLIGLFVFGIGVAFLIRSSLGAGSWDVLTQGISHHLPLSFGTLTVIMGGIVLLLWIPLRQKPGAGTVLNALLVGPSADFGLLVIPQAEPLLVRILYIGLGIGMIGLGTGLYIGSRFGTGPRDGLMTGLNRVTGKPIWMVRVALELTVVALGWMLGGTVGVGTVAAAILIGPACQFFMRIFHIPLSSDAEPKVVATVADGRPQGLVEEPVTP